MWMFELRSCGTNSAKGSEVGDFQREYHNPKRAKTGNYLGVTGAKGSWLRLWAFSSRLLAANPHPSAAGHSGRAALPRPATKSPSDEMGGHQVLGCQVPGAGEPGAGRPITPACAAYHLRRHCAALYDDWFAYKKGDEYGHRHSYGIYRH